MEAPDFDDTQRPPKWIATDRPPDPAMVGCGPWPCRPPDSRNDERKDKKLKKGKAIASDAGKALSVAAAPLTNVDKVLLMVKVDQDRQLAMLAWHALGPEHADDFQQTADGILKLHSICSASSQAAEFLDGLVAQLCSRLLMLSGVGVHGS
jgi:hypothetical protein